MSRRTQRVGSSPIGPIKKADREKLASLDRRIDRKKLELRCLFRAWGLSGVDNRVARDKKREQIAKLDEQRKALRIWMKSCVKR